MSDPQTLSQTLQKEGNLAFPENRAEAEDLLEALPDLREEQREGSTFWWEVLTSGKEILRIRQYPTGHRVFYLNDTHRFLMTDPGGTALHEAEWVFDAERGDLRLNRVRMQLDCRQWVGLQPKAKTFTTHINIKSQPGWKNMQLDDLRRGAAQVWGVPFSEIQYFYRDENFVSTAEGEYDVQLHKDSLYVLIDGTFERTVFVSHMFSVNWEKLDLIPVVELFQSTLPGSGGAVFEFIWGLYEDQETPLSLSPLRYRGLPTYPSKEAFNIFKAFFDPSGVPEDRLFDTFMNPDSSHDIEWSPRSDPPLRYFDEDQNLCVTVQDGFLYKATISDDTTGLPYINTSRGARGPCGRYLEIQGGHLILHDGEHFREIPMDERWQVRDEIPPVLPPALPFDWRYFFGDALPEIDPVKILYTVPFYPEGASDIEESATQPLVVDQIIQYMEETEDMEDRLERAESALIHTFDTVISGLIDCTHKRNYTVLYGDPEFATKNAQLLWGYGASRDQLENLKNVRFLAEADHVEQAYQEQYDLVFKWIPFMYHAERETAEQILKDCCAVLKPGGMLFLAGPMPIEGLMEHYGLKVLRRDAVGDMPYYRQHLKMCPENTINPYLTVFFAEKK